MWSFMQTTQMRYRMLVLTTELWQITRPRLSSIAEITLLTGFKAFWRFLKHIFHYVMHIIEYNKLFGQIWTPKLFGDYQHCFNAPIQLYLLQQLTFALFSVIKQFEILTSVLGNDVTNRIFVNWSFRGHAGHGSKAWWVKWLLVHKIWHYQRWLGTCVQCRLFRNCRTNFTQVIEHANSEWCNLPST